MELARAALANDATDPDALALLTAIKMRQNRSTALWWHLSHRWARISAVKRGVLAAGLFLVYVVLIGLTDSALEKIIHATAWGLFLYGLVGEQLFESAVAREIRGFRLRRDF